MANKEQLQTAITEAKAAISNLEALIEDMETDIDDGTEYSSASFAEMAVRKVQGVRDMLRTDLQ